MDKTEGVSRSLRGLGSSRGSRDSSHLVERAFQLWRTAIVRDWRSVVGTNIGRSLAFCGSRFSVLRPGSCESTLLPRRKL